VTHIETLAAMIAATPVAMAVVDYAGRVDADGPVTEASPDRRRYGTRDLRHVAIYGLKVVQLNPAARDANLRRAA
jgi:hypothetical protein